MAENEQSPMIKKEGRILLEITRKMAPFAPEEQLGKYVVQRWTWREKVAATSASRVMIDIKQKVVKFDTDIYYEQMMLICVKEAPMAWNLDAVRNLDPDIGDRIQAVCLDVNELSTIEKADFLGQFGSEKDTPGLISTGSVKPLEVSQSKAE